MQIKKQGPLFDAARFGRADEIAGLLGDCSCTVDDHNDLGQTALHIAAEFNQVAVIRLLVDNGASVNFDDKNNYNEGKSQDDRGTFRRLPIHCAAKSGATEAIKILAKLKSSLVEKEADGYTPLHIAVQNGHLEAVKTLCDLQVDIEVTNELKDSDDRGRTPLHLAIINRHVDVALELLKRRANYLAEDSNGITPFFWASKLGLTAITEAITKLIAANSSSSVEGDSTKTSEDAADNNEALLAALNTIDKDGNSELHRAALTGATKTITELCKYGANVDALNKAGHTPLFVACDIEAIKKTIKKKLDQNSQKLEERQKPVVEELLRQKANRNIPDKRGDTPLHLVTETCCNSLVKLLCDNNTNVNSPNEAGMTALHVAAREQNSPGMVMILKAAGNVHVYDEDKNTPLHTLLLNEDDDEYDDDDLKFIGRCVDALLGKGCLVKVMNLNNETPLSLAEDNFGEDSDIYQKIRAAAENEESPDASDDNSEQLNPDEPQSTPAISLTSTQPTAEIAASPLSPVSSPAFRTASPEIPDADVMSELEKLTRTLIEEHSNAEEEEDIPSEEFPLKPSSNVEVTDLFQNFMSFNHADSEFISFCKKMIDQAQSFGDTTSITNSQGENFFHILTKNPAFAALFDQYISKLQLDQLEKLMTHTNSAKETALHYACRCLNLEMLKKFTTCFARNFLLELAQSKNSEGLNALQLLLYSGLDPLAQKYKATIDRGDMELSRCKRNLFNECRTNPIAFPMLQLFTEKLGDPRLALDTDPAGNNALMLACYTNDTPILIRILETLHATDHINQAASQTLVNFAFTPLQFICAFGDRIRLSLILAMLANLATDKCIKQNALQHCYATQVAKDDPHFYDLVTLLANFYDKSFEKSILRKGLNQPSLLVKSLHHDQVLSRILMSRKHVSMRYAILIDACEGRFGPESPRYGFFPQAVTSESGRLLLIRHLFRINWSNALISNIANLFQTFRNNRIVWDNDPKTIIINILFNYLNNFHKATAEISDAFIVLAIFYQVPTKVSELNHREVQFLETCAVENDENDYPVIMLQTLGRFLQEQSNGNPAMRKEILSRIFRSKSLYFAMLIKCLPKLEHFEKTVEEKFISTIQSMAESSTQSQKGEDNGNGIK